MGHYGYDRSLYRKRHEQTLRFKENVTPVCGVLQGRLLQKNFNGLSKITVEFRVCEGGGRLVIGIIQFQDSDICKMPVQNLQRGIKTD